MGNRKQISDGDGRYRMGGLKIWDMGDRDWDREILGIGS
jgi:hypothetical protein